MSSKGPRCRNSPSQDTQTFAAANRAEPPDISVISAPTDTVPSRYSRIAATLCAPHPGARRMEPGHDLRHLERSLLDGDSISIRTSLKDLFRRLPRLTGIPCNRSNQLEPLSCQNGKDPIRVEPHCFLQISVPPVVVFQLTLRHSAQIC